MDVLGFFVAGGSSVAKQFTISRLSEDALILNLIHELNCRAQLVWERVVVPRAVEGGHIVFKANKFVEDHKVEIEIALFRAPHIHLTMGVSKVVVTQPPRAIQRLYGEISRRLGVPITFVPEHPPYEEGVLNQIIQVLQKA